MTKQDFELIARVVRTFAGADAGSTCNAALFDRARVARHFARELAHTNPLFNRERFIKACGVIDSDSLPNAAELRDA